MGSTLITWSSKNQSLVFISLRKVEYIALATIMRETLWLHEIFRNYNILELEKFFIYKDNQNAIVITNNPTNHGQMKHWDMEYVFIKQCIEKE